MNRNLEVTDVTVATLLDKLESREWMIPKFQRDFVWTVNDVASLVHSILESRPIGMATIWEQPDQSGLPLEPVSIPDSDQDGARSIRPFKDNENIPSRVYAVLDGRQRCAAIAMAFGGLRSLNNRYRYAGRFFLDVSEMEPSKRVKFIKEVEIQRKRLDVDANCIGQGLFPLASNIDGEALMPQWYRYTQGIANPENYPDGQLPDAGELERRNQVLSKAFDGLMATKLAVYIVPSIYSLADICEIFETLNTTGTRVSTVDLIHSWLYADTQTDEEPLLLREWIDDLGDLDGAIGWASSADRPELIAQIATACFVALEEKPVPREVGRHQQARILSVKSGDLLATPTLHWRNLIEHQEILAEYLGDFQEVVASGRFSWKSCPYPVTAAIYIALRWHHRFDRVETHNWSVQDLNSLYKAFFWRNALGGRYDQGFLTQLGTDLVSLKEKLKERQEYQNFGDWAASCEDWLINYMNVSIPDHDELKNKITNKQTGALQKALMLPMLSLARVDLLDPETSIEYPKNLDVQLHHIYPSAWCRNNNTAELREWLDTQHSELDWINSVANLMPLSRRSNNEWKAANPGAILRDRGIDYGRNRNVLGAALITEEAFNQLLSGADGIPQFWLSHADALAEFILRNTSVTA